MGFSQYMVTRPGINYPPRDCKIWLNTPKKLSHLV